MLDNKLCHLFDAIYTPYFLYAVQYKDREGATGTGSGVGVGHWRQSCPVTQVINYNQSRCVVNVIVVGL